QVMGDSFRASQTQEAYLAWGHVDMVAADGGRFFDPAIASELAAEPGLKSSLAGVQAGVELPSSVVDLDRGNAKPLVTLVGFDPATQGPFGRYVLADGRTTLGQDLGSHQRCAQLCRHLRADRALRCGKRRARTSGPRSRRQREIETFSEA